MVAGGEFDDDGEADAVAGFGSVTAGAAREYLNALISRNTGTIVVDRQTRIQSAVRRAQAGYAIRSARTLAPRTSSSAFSASCS